MAWLLAHLRDKLLAGAFAAVPVLVLVFVGYWIETNTRLAADTIGLHFPGLGFLIVMVGCYLLGLAVTSFLGQFFLSLGDRLIQMIPGLNQIYRIWKDVLVVPDKGMFHQVVVVPEVGQSGQIGFTSGRPLPGDPDGMCVFLPNIPNPLSGRLLIVRRESCIVLPISVDEAFKFLLSTGNYSPPALRGFGPLRPDSDRLPPGPSTATGLE